MPNTYTVNGITYPWEGPVGTYADDKRVPEIRSDVRVEYLNMNDSSDRNKLAEILTGIKNGKFVQVGEPTYTIPEGGHQHVTIMYDYQYACDPDYNENSDKADKPENEEIPVEENLQKETEEPEQENQLKEDLGPEKNESEEDAKTVYEIPENALRMSSLKQGENNE